MSQGFCNARAIQFQFFSCKDKRIILVLAHKYCIWSSFLTYDIASVTYGTLDLL